jgi:hypothetical protein
MSASGMSIAPLEDIAVAIAVQIPDFSLVVGYLA